MDTNDTTTQESAGSASPTETPPPAANVKTFTQEEVDRIAAKARDEGRKSALKPTAPALTPTPPAPQPTTTDESERLSLKQLKAENEEIKLRLAFDKRVAKRNLSEDVADELFEMLKVQKPGDVDEWLDKKSQVFGFKPQPQPASPATIELPKPPVTAPSAPTGPVNPVTQNGLPDIFNFSEAQLASMPVGGLRAEFEKILAVGNRLNGAPPRPKPAARK